MLLRPAFAFQSRNSCWDHMEKVVPKANRTLASVPRVEGQLLAHQHLQRATIITVTKRYQCSSPTATNYQLIVSVFFSWAMDVQELWPRTSQMNKPMDSSSHPIHMTLPGRGRASFTRFYSSHCEIKKNEKERRTEKVPWRTINRDRLPTTVLVWGSVPVASDRGAPRAFLSSAGGHVWLPT